MIKTIVTLGLMTATLLLAPVFASVAQNQVQNQAQNQPKTQDMALMLAVVGTIDGYREGMNAGLMAMYGKASEEEIARITRHALSICYKDHRELRAAPDIVAAYFKANPRQGNEGFNQRAVRALAKAMPCKKKDAKHGWVAPMLGAFYSAAIMPPVTLSKALTIWAARAL